MKYDVKIYIETTRGVKLKHGVGMYMVEFIKPNGDTETRQGFVTEEDTTENIVALKTVIAAMNILIKQCEVTVITTNEIILAAERHGWLSKWRIEGWTNSAGEPVKNKELWQQVDELMDKHLVIFVREHNPYKTIMDKEIHKKKEADIWTT